ncbi:hypothetical protein [Dysgonomonas sp. HGC4]|uniref:hypothetical protein n=1 Tax=Dysgonomonas sp. HGC4 TaxID=1658009 RepID=UPI0006821BF6|nr:hypothetical protein [Dysgonomonas sp. HGC4]MBD8349372.1 hypothetical protein [Dysgonomonas sp. HGC4]
MSREPKGISVIVIYAGYIPEDADIDEVENKIKSKVDDCFRLSFPEKNDEEYDEDLHEPFFTQESIVIAKDGYTLMS